MVAGAPDVAGRIRAGPCCFRRIIGRKKSLTKTLCNKIDLSKKILTVCRMPVVVPLAGAWVETMKLLTGITLIGNLFRLALVISWALVMSVVPIPAQDRPLLPGQLPRPTRAGGTIFRCLFDPEHDVEDGDGWPDHWTRKRGIDQGISFPDYLDIGLVRHRNPFSNFALRMDMQGGGAAVFSPKIPVRPGMSYTVSAYVDATNLVFDRVSILLMLYAGNEARPVMMVPSESVRNTNGWRKLEIGPVVADQAGVESLSVGLLVLPEQRQDYGAMVHFTNIEIREGPTVTLTTSNRHHLFFAPGRIGIDAHLSGVDPEQQSIEFFLEDPFGRIIARKEIEMTIGNLPASRFVAPATDRERVLAATVAWQEMPIVSPGFYRVRLGTPDRFVRSLDLPENVFFEDPLQGAPPLTLVVMPAGSFLSAGQFGWNLDGWTLEEIERRQELLAQSGISGLKIPAWIPDKADPELRRRLNRICDDLVRRQVHVVGLLRPVPQAIRDRIKFGPVTAASLFSLQPGLWTDALQPMLRELSLLVKDWQWTSDEDRSIIDLPDFPDRFDELRRSFDRDEFGFGVGFAWDWSEELPERFGPPDPNPDPEGRVSEFVSLGGARALTPEEMEHYLLGNPASRIRRFVALTPLSDRDYDLRDRIIDLVRKMVVSKVAGAEMLFLARPLDRHTGLLREDATPGELYLPWRTTATMLSGRGFLGSYTMPGGSRNYCFDLGGDQAVTVLWNDSASPERPVLEKLYLGTETEIVDVWGRRSLPQQQGRDQVVPVGPIPIFVTGLDARVARLRIDFQLRTREIPSWPNRKNSLVFSLANATDSFFVAQVAPVGPKPGAWIVEPAKPISLEPGRTASSAFAVTLTGAANTGTQPIRIDLETEGAEPLKFSVYDELVIGESDVFMEISSRMNREGDLEVFQAFINDSEKTYTYSCRLFIPDRVHQQVYVSQKGFGRFEHVYTISRAQELLDRGVNEFTIRARPIGQGQPMVYTVPIHRGEIPDRETGNAP